MRFQQRRATRGVDRDTPEDILRRAILLHQAIKARDAQRAGGQKAAAQPNAPMRKPAARKADGEAKRRADFAGAMARSAFGRSYWKDGSKTE
jgi:hypothetical protein